MAALARGAAGREAATTLLYRRLGRRILRYLMALGLLALALPASAEPRRVALLVGAGDYVNLPGHSLEGPPHDVAALRDVLVRRWGFRAQDIKILVDAQASRANILAELAALGQRSGAGDEVLVYFSGHGTSALDATASLPVPHGSGAFIPADFDPARGAAGLIVGSTDLRPLLSALENGGRRLWVISDSCYSGQQVRSLKANGQARLPERMLPMQFGKEARDQRADLALAALAPRPAAYPYHATAYLAASAEGERATDIPRAMLGQMPTLDGKPHGALTDALLRVLEGQLVADLNGDGLLSLNEVHRAVSDFMSGRAYAHTPQRLPAAADDQHGLGERPVLGARGVAAAPRALPLPVQPLRVRLDGAAPALAQVISGISEVRMVNGAEPADLVLRVSGARLGMSVASGDTVATMPLSETSRALAQLRQLAWAQRLRGLAERYRRGALEADIDPAEFGGNFVLGSKIAFVVRPDRAATLVLLNINSDGKIAVLYPYVPQEDAALPGGQATFIPGSVVQLPLGMDFQFMFAFDTPPPGLERLHGLSDADADDPRLREFERSLAAAAGKFTFATTSLRTLKP